MGTPNCWHTCEDPSNNFQAACMSKSMWQWQILPYLYNVGNSSLPLLADGQTALVSCWAMNLLKASNHLPPFFGSWYWRYWTGRSSIYISLWCGNLVDVVRNGSQTGIQCDSPCPRGPMWWCMHFLSGWEERSVCHSWRSIAPYV